MFGKKKTTGAATPVPQVSNKKKVEDYLSLNTMPRSAKLLIPCKKNSGKSEKFPDNLQM